MKLINLSILFLILCSFSFHASSIAPTATDENIYNLRCAREAIVEVENKVTGQKKQVEKEPKVTVGTRILSPTRSFIDAEVFIGGKKEYRFKVDKLTLKVEQTPNSKKIHYDCKATRYENDGSTRDFCGPWIEVFEIDSFGTEIFKGYEVNGVLEPSTEIRFRSELPDGSIVESLVNTQVRVTFENDSEIWRIYREHQNCLMVPQQ